MQVKQGRAILDAERPGRDPSRMAVIVARPARPDVEGQSLYEALVSCPSCGGVGWVVADTDMINWGICGTCGTALEY